MVRHDCDTGGAGVRAYGSELDRGQVPRRCVGCVPGDASYVREIFLQRCSEEHGLCCGVCNRSVCLCVVYCSAGEHSITIITVNAITVRTRSLDYSWYYILHDAI